MTLKRAQGRPVRGVDHVGREKLLRSARTLIRTKLTHNITRQDVARLAGVTPALVNYYFKEKSELIEAATRPIIDEYIATLNRILLDPQDYKNSLMNLIVLFISFSADEPGILDVFLDNASMNSAEDRHLILSTLDNLVTFLSNGAEAAAWRDVEPIFTLFAIWGMCKVISETPALPVPQNTRFANSGSRHEQATLIMELLMNGITPQVGRRIDVACENAAVPN